MRDRRRDIDCERYRLAISAGLDGEDAGLEGAGLERHLAGCAGCRRFAAEAADLQESVRVAAHEATPDLTRPILTAIGEEQRRPGLDPAALRAGLAAVGIVQLLVALPDLLSGIKGTPVHVARELGSFDLALAVGFLFAAWRPLRAYGMVPIVAALVAGLAVTTGIDVMEGRVVATTEVGHLLELMGLALLWALARVVTVSEGPPLGGRPRLVSG
jgi:predicted anti-sigma-YlaC factor YlaD